MCLPMQGAHQCKMSTNATQVCPSALDVQRGLFHFRAWLLQMQFESAAYTLFQHLLAVPILEDVQQSAFWMHAARLSTSR